MLKHLLIFAFMVSSVVLSAQLNFSGTTVGAPTAKFPNFGATPATCSSNLNTGSEPYRVFTFRATNTTTVTVNFTNIIDGGGTDDTGFSWYTGTAFNPANACTNFIAVGDNLNVTNKTINVVANTSYSIAVIGIFGTGDAFAFTLTVAAGSVLPMELLSFTAKNTEGGQNILTWVTASEKNNKGFDIERSTDGNTFHNIGQVKGNNKPSSYQFVDNQPFATTYYRLRQIDNDGTETLSKVVSVELKGKGKGLAVYPNPVSSLLNIENTEGSSFQILNLLGQQVLTGKTPPSEAGWLDVSALPQGTYILKVGAEQAKFLKQ
jgi:hypothetical protein